jgi:protein TonB
MILSADVLDIIFDGRNKAYGAYDLRKTYQQRVGYALLGMAGVCLLFFAYLFAGSGKKVDKRDVMVKDFFISPDLPMVKPTVIPPPPPIPRTPQVKVQVTAFKPPQIVPDNQVTETPHEVKTLDNTHIGLTNQDGPNSGADVVAPPEQSTTGNGNGLPAQKKEDYEGVFITVEKEAEFPGGKAAWMRYLERNLNSSIPTEEGAPAGRYTVVVSFLVDKNGAISDVVAENNPLYGTAKEAVRVILNGPKWSPALQNGHNVAYRVRQSITFVVSDNP